LLGLRRQGLAITIIELGTNGFAEHAAGQGTNQHGGGTATAAANLTTNQNTGCGAGDCPNIFLIQPLVLRHVGATCGTGNAGAEDQVTGFLE